MQQQQNTKIWGHDFPTTGNVILNDGVLILVGVTLRDLMMFSAELQAALVSWSSSLRGSVSREAAIGEFMMRVESTSRSSNLTMDPTSWSVWLLKAAKRWISAFCSTSAIHKEPINPLK